MAKFLTASKTIDMEAEINSEVKVIGVEIVKNVEFAVRSANDLLFTDLKLHTDSQIDTQVKRIDDSVSKLFEFYKKQVELLEVQLKLFQEESGKRTAYMEGLINKLLERPAQAASEVKTIEIIKEVPKEVIKEVEKDFDASDLTEDQIKEAMDCLTARELAEYVRSRKDGKRSNSSD